MVIITLLKKPPVRALLPHCDEVHGRGEAGAGGPGSLVGAGVMASVVGPLAGIPAGGPETQ